MLSVSADVTLTIVPHKPEFFSWESVTMQSYIKTGGFALLVLVIMGMIYEVIRWLRSRKNTVKVIPRRGKLYKTTFPLLLNSFSFVFKFSS